VSNDFNCYPLAKHKEKQDDESGSRVDKVQLHKLLEGMLPWSNYQEQALQSWRKDRRLTIWICQLPQLHQRELDNAQ
jgi:hypothetical protein